MNIRFYKVSFFFILLFSSLCIHAQSKECVTCSVQPISPGSAGGTLIDDQLAAEDKTDEALERLAAEKLKSNWKTYFLQNNKASYGENPFDPQSSAYIGKDAMERAIEDFIKTATAMSDENSTIYPTATEAMKELVMIVRGTTAWKSGDPNKSPEFKDINSYLKATVPPSTFGDHVLLDYGEKKSMPIITRTEPIIPSSTKYEKRIVEVGDRFNEMNKAQSANLQYKDFFTSNVKPAGFLVSGGCSDLRPTDPKYPTHTALAEDRIEKTVEATMATLPAEAQAKVEVVRITQEQAENLDKLTEEYGKKGKILIATVMRQDNPERPGVTGPKSFYCLDPNYIYKKEFCFNDREYPAAVQKYLDELKAKGETFSWSKVTDEMEKEWRDYYYPHQIASVQALGVTSGGDPVDVKPTEVMEQINSYNYKLGDYKLLSPPPNKNHPPIRFPSAVYSRRAKSHFLPCGSKGY